MVSDVKYNADIFNLRYCVVDMNIARVETYGNARKIFFY